MPNGVMPSTGLYDGYPYTLNSVNYVYELATNRWRVVSVPVTVTSYTDLTNQPITNNWHFMAYAEISAAGTTQAAGTLITKSLNKILAASAAANALRLPEASSIVIPSGKFLDIFISNGTTQTLAVFPPVGGQINYSGVNVANNVGTYGTLRVILSDTTNNIYTQI